MRTPFAAALLVSAVVCATPSRAADHLQCFKIKDAATKATYTTDVVPTGAGFPAANGCVVKTPAALLCIDAAAQNVQPTPPDATAGADAQRYLCYKVKCPKAMPTATLEDQFGTHQVSVKSSSLLCAPVTGPTTTSTTIVGGTTTTTTMPTCDLPGSCPAGSGCINLVDNSGQNTFGLRIGQLDLLAPAAFGTGVIGPVFTQGVEMNLSACMLNGTGTINWLLKVDKTAQTVQIGGAKPVVDPLQGYSFVNQIAFGVPIAPAITPVSIVTGSFSSMPVDVVLPIYLDSGGTQGFPLPLRHVTVGGQLSADQSCVGTYNAAGLTPPDCLGPRFLDGGSLHGSVTLEDADAIVIPVLNTTLCVLLSGDAATYGDGGSPTACARSAGAIVFQGDYCSATQSPATVGCHDAMEVGGTFAASGVKIN